MCPPSYQHNDFAVIHSLGQMMYRYTLLVPMNERMLNKPSIECNISGCKLFQEGLFHRKRSDLFIKIFLLEKHLNFGEISRH